MPGRDTREPEVTPEVVPIYTPGRGSHWTSGFGDRKWPVYSLTMDKDLKEALDRIRAKMGKRLPATFTGVVRYLMRLGIALLEEDRDSLKPGLMVGRRDLEAVRWRHLREVGKAGGHTSSPAQQAVYTIDGWFAGYEIPEYEKEKALAEGYALVGWDGKVTVPEDFSRRARITLNRVLRAIGKETPDA